jgi:DNA-binding transcriptional ArsR family regulator
MAIMAEVEKQEIMRPGRNGPELDNVRHNKLYAAWHIASTFRQHWQHPRKTSENDMLWILYNRGWSRNQGISAVIAWWREHRRKIDDDMCVALELLAGTVWNEVQKKKAKAKDEAQQNSLRNRILVLLRQHPATTAFLADKLTATSKAVDSHLYRLRKEGIVERLSWGLYGIPGTGTTIISQSKEPKVVVKDEPQATSCPRQSITLADIDDDIAESTEAESCAYAEPPSCSPSEVAWTSLDLPTAEPRWSRI